MDENNNIFPTSTDYIIGGTSTSVDKPTSAVETTSTPEPTPAPSANTANIYEQANDAAVNPTSNTIADTPIYTTSEPTGSSTMDSYSVPSSTTYASTGATYSNDTYTSTGETTESKGLAIASLTCGILSILLGCCCGCGCFNIIFSLPGIICGVLQKPMSDGKKPGMATGGIITSAVGIVLGIIISVVSFYLIDSGMIDSLNY